MMKKPEKPDESELLAFLDNELTPARQSEIRQLLGADWELRAQLARLERRIEQYITATAQQSERVTPSVDDLWNDFSHRQRSSPPVPAALLPDSSFLSSLPDNLSRWWPTRLPLPARWRMVSAFALSFLFIATLAGVLWRAERTVSAQELLQRSVAAETVSLKHVSQPVVYRKIQVKRSGVKETVMWESWNDARRQQFRQRVADQHGARFLRADEKTSPELITELETVLRLNQFDPQSPLSATAFATWRGKIRPAAETIAASNEGLNLTTVVATPATRNAILEASLLVRKTDWHAVALQLSVQSEEGVRRYELSETAYEVLPLEALTGAAELTPTPVLAVSLSASISPSPKATATIVPALTPLPAEADLRTAEVAALYALHQAQADLGEQIEVVREANRQIVVQGLVETEARKQQLAQALSSIPLVNTRLQSVEDAVWQAAQKPPQPEQPVTILTPSEAATSSATPGRSAFEKRLAQYFSAAGEGQKNTERKMAELSDAVIANSAAARSDAWALRRLAERFSTAREQQLHAASRQHIEEMLRHHLLRLRQRTSMLRGRLEPVLRSIADGTNAPPLRAAEASWQAQTLTVFKAVERVHQQAGRLFTAADTGAAPEYAARQMLEAMLSLENALQALAQQLNQ